MIKPLEIAPILHNDAAGSANSMAWNHWVLSSCNAAKDQAQWCASIALDH